MKLAGPRRNVRFVAGMTDIGAVVCGVFPPERAPQLRAVVAAVLDERRPMLREALAEARAQNARYLDALILGGDPRAPEPRGILR